MAINWTGIKGARSKMEAMNVADESIKANKWTISEILEGPTGMREFVYGRIAGYDPDTMRQIPGMGTRRTFRLKVLSAAACKGKKHGEDVKPSDTVRRRVGENIIDPITGKMMTTHRRNEYLAQGREVAQYEEYTVDADCCVTVGFEAGYAMLQSRGKYNNRPRFYDKVPEPKTKPQDVRTICNWWFEEAPEDYKASAVGGDRRR